MTQKLTLYWRWARQKMRARCFAQFTPWGIPPRGESAVGDNFPGLDRAVPTSRFIDDQTLKEWDLR